MFSGKNNKFCKILLYILPVVMILGTDSLPVDAATFNHVHTNACYQTVVKTCTNHYLRPGREHQSFHCSNCGTMQPCTYLTWTDECLSGLREDYYCAWEITCDVCGNTIDSRPPGAPLTHQYQATELCCGKTENTAAATTSISASPTGWTAGNVTISSNVASNDSTFSVAGFSFNGGGFSGSSSATVSQNGTYSFTVKDNRGRTVTDSITVSNIDKQAPSLSLSKDSTGWTNGSVKISASGSDGQSGVNGYSLNGGGYSGTSSWSVTENGNYSVTVRDNVGNTSTQSISVSNIDRVNPTVSLSANTTDWTNSGVVITASGSDGQSGLASSAFSFNGTAYGSETSWEVGVNGSYSVYVKDNAGNSGSSSITISNIDKQAPSLSLSKNTEKWCEEGIDVIASADDNLSGIDGYSFNGGDFGGSSSWHVNANGTYSVTVRDKAGNTQTSSITVSNVGTDPEIIAQRKAAEEKARLEKEAQEKERKNREAKEKAEKEAKEKAAAEKAAAEKAAAEKVAQEKALAERAAAEKAVWEKSQADRAAAEKAAYEKAQAEKAALEKAQAEKEALEKALLEQEQLANSLSSESPSTTSANNNTKSSVSSESKVDSTSSKQDENSKDSQDSNQNDVSGNLISVNNSAGGDSNSGPGGSSNGKNVTAGNTDLSNGIMFDSYSESFIADNVSPTSQSLIQRLLSSPSGMFSVGIGLALSALLLLSTLNIVYYKDNGKIKPVSTAKIRRDKKRMFISVNPENLNEDRKYKVFLSIWTRLFRGERSIVFDIDGKKPATPINDEESFVYNG